MSEWQPIKSAPEGEYILVFSPDCDEHHSKIMIASFNIVFGQGDWCELNGSGLPIKVRLTHWMPLPEPPDEAQP